MKSMFNISNSDFINFINSCIIFRFTYQAVVWHGNDNDSIEEPIAIVESQSSPILIQPSHLGGMMSAGQIFNIGVRIKTRQVRD